MHRANQINVGQLFSGMYMPHLPGFREKELSQYFLLTLCLNGFLLAIDSTLH